MSSSENHIHEGEDDTDSQELFESFMEITKHVENLESEADKEKESGSINQPPSNVLDEPSQGGSRNIDNIKVTDEENVNKRLSKAVDELSDLEKQLSLMISTGSCSSPSYQTNDNIGDTSSSQGLQVTSCENVDGDGPNSSENQDKSPETGDNTTCKTAGSPSDNDDDVFETEKKVSKNANSSESQNASTELVSKTELPALVIQVDNNINEKGVDSNNVSEGQEKSHAINVVTTDQNSSLESRTQAQDNLSEQKDPVKTSEQDNYSKEICSEKQPESYQISNQEKLEKVGQTCGADDTLKNASSTLNNEQLGSEIYHDDKDVGKTSQDDGILSTKDEQPQSDPINLKNETKLSENYDSKKETSCTNDISQTDSRDGPDTVDNSLEEVSSNGHPQQPSTPEIEILMTDESGISEHKSLESLEVESENEVRPESPALSDEGIDSDARSLDDLDDEVDDTFDSGSALDLASRDNHLNVERNRMGSNSSTVSEKEFRNSGHIVKPEREESAKVYVKGYLLKLGGSGLTPKNWRRRWFVLKEDNCLYYYKHAKDKTPCGVIVLCNYSITKAPDSNKKYCFKLNKGGARTYHFCAVSDDNMREWMVALMKSASAVTATGTSFQILEGNVHNVSIPALSIKDPECHGYLSKKGQGIKTWKRRYCVLKNGYLYYYTDMSNTTALGVAKLLGYQIKSGETRGKHFCFYGSPPDDSMRIYHFSAETENDRDRWMQRMEESIERGNTS